MIGRAADDYHVFVIVVVVVVVGQNDSFQPLHPDWGGPCEGITTTTPPSCNPHPPVTLIVPTKTPTIANSTYGN